MKYLSLFLVVWGLFGSVLIAEPFNAKIAIESMRVNNQQEKVGRSESLGVYFLCIEKVLLAPDMTPNLANELGLAQGKKAVAAFFGTKVKAMESEETRTVTTNSGGKETTSQQQVIQEMTRIDINQFLRGVVILQSERRGEYQEVICFAAQKIADAANEMKRELEKLPPDTVRAAGIAMSSGNDDLQVLQQRALAAALRSAVEQVMGASVTAATQVQDAEKIKAKIFSVSAGFVETYRIVEGSALPGGWKVIVLAKVARDKLMESYASSLKAMGDPGFFIRAQNRELYLTFARYFNGLGLRITGKSEADYIIDVIGDYDIRIHPSSNAEGIQLSLWVRIFDAKSGQELLSLKNDPRKAVVFHSSGARQREIATQKAYDQIKKGLHAELNKLIGRMSASGRPIRIVFDEYTTGCQNEVEKIGTIISMIPGCSNANVKVNATTQTAIFSLDYTGSMADLNSFLNSAMSRDLKSGKIPVTKSVENNTLTLSF